MVVHALHQNGGATFALKLQVKQHGVPYRSRSQVLL
jgi:hypothetical protein